MYQNTSVGGYGSSSSSSEGGTSIISSARSGASAAPSTAAAAAAPAPAAADSQTHYQAAFDYAPQGMKEMGLTKGDIVKVLDKSHTDWWKVQLGGRKGMVPSNYLSPL
jgi:hypothetical protein